MANISDPTVLCCAADSPTTCGKQQPHCPADKMEIQPDSEQRYVAIWGQILTQETYNVHPTTITEQISCYHQTIRLTSPQSSNKSSFLLCKTWYLFLDGKPVAVVYFPKMEKKLTESQPACRETYLRASVCAALWAEPHGRRVNEAQVQLIRGRRSVAHENKGRKCRNMTWNTKLQNKTKRVLFYPQLDRVSRGRRDKRIKFAFTFIWESLLIIVSTPRKTLFTSRFSREKEFFCNPPFELQCYPVR